MKNNKGFTLVEIIAVIAVLALISAIAIPNILSTRTRMNEKAYNKKTSLIEKAAVRYALDNANAIRYDIKNRYGECSTNTTYCECSSSNCKYKFEITVKELIEKDYLSSEKKKSTDVCEMKDPRNTADCLDNVIVNVKLDALYRNAEAKIS